MVGRKSIKTLGYLLMKYYNPVFNNIIVIMADHCDHSIYRHSPRQNVVRE